MGSIGRIGADAECDGRQPCRQTLVTPEEAIARGLVREVPPPARCAYCGRPLRPLGVPVFGSVAWVSHEPCECEGAERERREEERRALDEMAAERERRLERSGIPLRFRKATPTEARCAAYADALPGSGPNGLFIHGPVGTGKTHNAAAVAIAATDRGLRTVFTSAIAIFSSIRETFDGGGSSKRALERYSSCEMLVLDDLGKESSSRWSLMTLFAIVNARYEGMRPTVVTSQYTLSQLRSRLASTGEAETATAIASRIAATCADVELTGPDLRRGAFGPRGTQPKQRTYSVASRSILENFK
ncbi:ATP-binding protein [Olsenella umbonata]|uniref:ATP-binding protein n=1 Tax=Parafannyhessea umbonata TaxID=604330 RepID=A0A1H1LEQ1_9ACTN|nr:ATP-binding protein [Parafannyhessea umbonata]NMF26093.1 ATP-binding protein [Parafannyhessea umbonata]RGS49894.1 ATP-binding protein [Olsenella sp. AF21-51]SDR73064.1 phage DNA replication protein (predicted replicative helicase loader) [Parafannyhessea umbonata]